MKALQRVEQDDGDYAWMYVEIEEIEAPPIPEICPECWNSVKPDADRCWAAVRALCS